MLSPAPPAALGRACAAGPAARGAPPAPAAPARRRGPPPAAAALAAAAAAGAAAGAGAGAARGRRAARAARRAGPAPAALQEGDVVAVVGAGGNVGRLVAQRLAEAGGYRVRGVLRDAAAARQGWAARCEGLELAEADTRDCAALAEALSDAQAVVCTTGVPAFGISGQWEGGNHPESVDHFGVKNAVHAWSSGQAAAPKRRFVLMSSVGVTRRDSFPYSILNGGGVLDAKARGELALKNMAKQRGFAYAVVRPGQLFGGPYANNRYLGTLFQLDKDAATQSLSITDGDTAVGDTLRSALAGVLIRCLFAEAPAMDFSVVNENGPAPSEDDVDTQLRKLSCDETTGMEELGEQLDKRVNLAAETFTKAIGNVVSGKVSDQARDE